MRCGWLANIDLDHFKLINDGYGHGVWDAWWRILVVALPVARLAGE